MLFADFGVDLLRKFSTKSDALSLLKHTFLKECLNFNVVFSFNELINGRSSIFIFYLHVDCSILCLNLDNFFVVDAKKDYFVIEIINLNSFLILFFGFYFNNVRFVEFYHFLLTFQSKIVFVFWTVLFVVTF